MNLDKAYEVITEMTKKKGGEMKKQYNKPVVAHYITEEALKELAEREQKVRDEEERQKKMKERIKRSWNIATERYNLNDQFHKDLLEYSQELQEWEEELEQDQKRQNKNELLNVVLTTANVLAISINLILLWGFLG